MSTYGSCDYTGVVEVTGSKNPSAALRHLPCTPFPEKGDSCRVPLFQNGGTGGTLVNSTGTKLVFMDVCVTIDRVEILRNVSGVARSGEILAILGPSGAGKSTLLNVLTARLIPSSGCVTLDGQKVARPMRRKISYVHQQDVFHPGLTLKETLTFTAMLRLPDSMSREQKSARIQEVVDLLELNKCIGTKMGGTFDAGLSGGERKRATIACELIANPKILILDEPTSGLDSAIASSLMSAMTEYASRAQKTVVTTIHQPSSQMFHMFSKVLLLTDGQVAYYGPGCKIVEHFSKLGLHCDPLYNPADFVLEQLKAEKETVKHIIDAALALRDEADWPIELKGTGLDGTPRDHCHGGIDGSEKHRKRKYLEAGNGWLPRTTKTVSHLDDEEKSDLLADEKKGGLLDKGPDSYPDAENPDQMSATSAAAAAADDDDVGLASSSEPKWPTGFVTQYTTLTRRAFILSRCRFLSLVNFCQIFIISFVAGMEWFQLPRTEDRTKDKLGLIFYVMLQQSFFFVHNSLYLVFDDHGVFLRERGAGIYRLSAYYLSLITAELPMTFVFAAFFLNIMYWMTGLMPSAPHFFAFWSVHLLTVLLAQSLGLFMGSAVPNRMNALTLSVTMMIVFLLTGGFYNTHVSEWFRWTRYISFMSYALSALCEIEFTYGYPIKCSPANMTSFPEYCTNGTSFPGEAFVESSNIKICSFATAFLVLLSISICLRTVTYYIIRFFRRPKC